MTIRVVLVEDELSIAELVRHRLELDNPEEFSVKVLTVSFDALAAADLADADVLVLDLWLNRQVLDENFPQATRIASLRPADCGLVVLSAVVGLIPQVEGVEFVADVVLEKTRIDELAEAIRLAAWRNQKEPSDLSPSSGS